LGQISSSLHDIETLIIEYKELFLTGATLLLAVLTFLLVRYERAKRKAVALEARSLLKICKVTEFDPSSVVGAYHAANFSEYLPINQDNEIADALRLGQSILLGGRPGVGKSHAAIHHISAHKKWFVIRPSKQAQFNLPMVRLKRRDYFLFFDDLHEYLGESDGSTTVLDLVNHVAAQARKLVVVGTIRTTLREFETIQSETKLLARWKYFELSNWTRGQGNNLAKRAGLDLTAWDETPLSVKQPSKEMQVRYRLSRTPTKDALRALRFLKDVGIKPVETSLLQDVYTSTVFGRSSAQFETAIYDLAAQGFLKQGTDPLEAYDPYVESISDWRPGVQDYETLKQLLYGKQRIDELLAIGQTLLKNEKLDEAETVYKQCIELNLKADRAYYQLGKVQAKQGQWSAAVDSYTKVTQIQPKRVGALYYLAHALKQSGRPKEAARVLKHAKQVSRGDAATSHLARAWELRKERQMDSALAEFDAAFTADKSLTQALSLKARALFDMDRPAEAVAIYEELQTQGAMTPESYVGLGEALRRLGRFAEAEKAFREAIRIKPKFARAYSYLGSLFSDMNRLTEAVEAAQRAIELEPNMYQAYFGLAGIYKRLGDLKGAEHAYRKTIRINPSFSLPYSYLSSLLRDQGRLEEAVEIDLTELELDKNKSPYGRGLALMELQRNAEAEEEFREAIRLKPDFASAYFRLGMILKEEQRFEEAAQAFREAIRIEPKYVGNFSELGEVLLQLKKPREAAQAYYDGEKVEPLTPEGYVGLGNALRQINDFEGSERAFREAIRLKPTFGWAYSYLGKLLSDAGRLNEALKCQRNAVRLEADSAEIYFGLAGILRRLEKFNEAEESYREAIRLAPDSALFHSYLGGLLKDRGRLDEAIAIQRKAIELDPTMPAAHFGLGLMCADLQKNAEAERSFREAIKRDPNLAAAYSRLGAILETDGRLEEAVDAYRKAIEKKPTYARVYARLADVLDKLGFPHDAVMVRQEAAKLVSKKESSKNPYVR
jgi:tetratricopeptide (TPR) repeat protein